MNEKNTVMKFQFLTYCLLGLLIISCTNNSHQIAGIQNISKNKPGSSLSDTVRIQYPSAVFYHPDSLQLQKIAAITNTMVFKSTMHEFFYQMRYSRIALKKYYPHIKIIEVMKARWLLFEKKDGTKECIDLDAKNDTEGLFVFDGKSEPRLLDMTNIETELRYYFLPEKNPIKKSVPQ